jgi:predicted  nucleic acid-binding Zn-ribbon protein
VRDQLELLSALQELDGRLRLLRREQQALPLRLKAPEREHGEACQELTSVQAEIDRNERQQHDLEMELQSTQDALDKVQRKLREVKTNREYSAVLTEIDAGKQQMTCMEDQLLQLMEQAEQKRQAKGVQEQRLRTARDVLQEQGHAVEQASELLNQKILVEREKRRQTAVGLNADLLEVYEKLTAQNDGSVVVHLNDGVCGGCHLKVQPQLISEIRLQESLHTCPFCRLILLWPAECPELEG